MAKPKYKSGISIRRGSKNYASFEDVFDEWGGELQAIQERLGELTPVFDEVAPFILSRVEFNIISGEMAKMPHRSTKARSGFTQKAREARGHGGDDTVLYASGALMEAIGRKEGSTSKAKGRRREVYRLVLGGITGRPGYQRLQEQMEGGVWNVPTRVTEEGTHYLDYDRLEGSNVSNEAVYGSRWTSISALPESTREVQYPPTDVFALEPGDVEVVRKIVSEWAQKMMSSLNIKKMQKIKGIR